MTFTDGVHYHVAAHQKEEMAAEPLKLHIRLFPVYCSAEKYRCEYRLLLWTTCCSLMMKWKASGIEEGISCSAQTWT